MTNGNKIMLSEDLFVQCINKCALDFNRSTIHSGFSVTEANEMTEIFKNLLLSEKTSFNTKMESILNPDQC